MLNELVKAKTNCGIPTIRAGSLGMVLRVHESQPQTCDVEFFDAAARSLGVYTIGVDKIEVTRPKRRRKSGKRSRLAA